LEAPLTREVDRAIRSALHATADQSARRKPAAAKALKTLHVLVDTREQTEWRFSEACSVERVTLSEGDYSIAGFSDRVRVERKSLSDLVGSITVGRERFVAECQRLTAYQFRALVIEATIEDVEAHAYRSETLPKSVLGSVFSLFVDYGLPAFWCANSRGAAQWCEWHFRRIASKWQPSGD
jgi:ERCC4-type nuclease